MLAPSDASWNRRSLSWQAWVLFEAYASQKRADGMLLERARACTAMRGGSSIFCPSNTPTLEASHDVRRCTLHGIESRARTAITAFLELLHRPRKQKPLPSEPAPSHRDSSSNGTGRDNFPASNWAVTSRRRTAARLAVR